MKFSNEVKFAETVRYLQRAGKRGMKVRISAGAIPCTEVGRTSLQNQPQSTANNTLLLRSPYDLARCLMYVASMRKITDEAASDHWRIELAENSVEFQRRAYI